MSVWLLYCGLALAVFFAMEGVAWVTHKYVMHGFLWCLHKSHHEPRKGFWELNDAFGLFFASISIAFLAWGAQLGGPAWSLFVGIGILGYGIVYFLAHDVLVHKRVAIRINPRKGYLRRLYQAHRLHHAVEGKDGCVSFGFVFAPSPESLKKQLEALAPLRRLQSDRLDAKRAASDSGPPHSRLQA
ncbi:MAG TPA: sterol desaturase family protein [Hyphomicrobiales bacterium]|nr:sterol desaturase family protein [Hyphomicrobiales bacterium]